MKTERFRMLCPRHGRNIVVQLSFYTKVADIIKRNFSNKRLSGKNVGIEENPMKGFGSFGRSQHVRNRTCADQQ